MIWCEFFITRQSLVVGSVYKDSYMSFGKQKKKRKKEGIRNGLRQCNLHFLNSRTIILINGTKKNIGISVRENIKIQPLCFNLKRKNKN